MTSVFLLFSLPGPWELIIILAIVFLLFGTKLPGVARSLGRSIIEFKKGLRGAENDEKLEGGSSEAHRLEGKAEEQKKGAR